MFLGGWLVFWIDRVHRRGERPTLATCRRFRGTVLWMQPKMIPILDLPAFLTLVSPMPHRSGSSPRFNVDIFGRRNWRWDHAEPIVWRKAGDRDPPKQGNTAVDRVRRRGTVPTVS